jgi:predicted TIM-barrel fold metal-dependent hydrolase
MPIHNCHIHTFTVRHVPDRFLPGPLMWALKHAFTRRILIWILEHIDPFDQRDLAQRYAHFLAMGEQSSQEDIFNVVAARYPADTVFVILPMDLAWMHAGNVPESLAQQHADVAALARRFAGRIVPFFAVDPRRPGVLADLKAGVEGAGFRGVKLYPNLGYSPQDSALAPVFDYAHGNRLPVLCHCSRSGVYDQALGAAEASKFADPDNYLPVLAARPDLRLCLAHFGGDAEWAGYLGSLAAGTSPAATNWVVKIRNLLSGGQYPNLYTDISYTIFRFDERIAALKALLADDRVRSRVLFGSDFYMIEQERFKEVDLVPRLRSALGDAWLRQLTEDNPRRFLGLP